MFPERPTPERPQLIRSRNKGGLETPLAGRIWRETRLIFAPPTWYDTLTYACLVFGVIAFFGSFLGLNILILGPEVLVWTGPLVFVSGLWGQLSSERMTCDTRAKSYARREGQGLFKRIIKGSLAELDAIVLLAEQDPTPTLGGQMVVYRLVLHWKHNKEPLLIIGTERHVLSTGMNLNAKAGRIAQNGNRWASILGLPFYDNSYFHSPEPLRLM